MSEAGDGKNGMSALIGSGVSLSDSQAGRQFLTFTLSEEVYGLAILSVKEILEFRKLTTVPMTPPFIRGVINLRGAAVPVLDLNQRFGGESRETTARSCIIIVEGRHDNHVIDMGLLVDAVNEVLDIPESLIEPPPDFGADARTDFIAGMANINEQFVILLNQDRLPGTEDYALLDRIAAAGGNAMEEASLNEE